MLLLQHNVIKRNRPAWASVSTHYILMFEQFFFGSFLMSLSKEGCDLPFKA